MQPKLSICIPTYNRQSLLRDSLAKICAQVDKLGVGQKVEILVSNNASTDDTESVANMFGGWINYSSNTTNIGPDANFLLLFEKAAGKYVWILSDDDAIGNDCVAYVLAMVEAFDFDYLFLRASSGRTDDSQRTAEQMSNFELFRRCSIHITFISSQIIRRDLVRPHISASRRFLGTLMAYFYVYLRALESAELCLVSSHREISPKPSNTGGYRFYEVWGRNVFDVLSESSFSSDRRAAAWFRRDVLLAIILPVTYLLRDERSGFWFLDDASAARADGPLSSSWIVVLLAAYRRLPMPPLRVLHLGVRASFRTAYVARRCVS